MTDPIAAVSLKLDALRADVAGLAGTLGEISTAFDGFNSGQAAILDGQKVTNRLLDTLVKAIAQEEPAESTADLLRELIVAVRANTTIASGLVRKVDAAVALLTTGEILDPA